MGCGSGSLARFLGHKALYPVGAVQAVIVVPTFRDGRRVGEQRASSNNSCNETGRPVSGRPASLSVGDGFIVPARVGLALRVAVIILEGNRCPSHD